MGARVCPKSGGLFMVTTPRVAGVTSAVCFSALLFSSQPVATAQAIALQPPAKAAALQGPTFTKDVLPIMQRSCQSCHRPGTPAPMSFMSYAEVRPWARAIKTKVTSREMPPWHIDRSIGEYANDPSLSDKE